MMAALSTQKPNLREGDLIKYKKFTEEYGQEGSWIKQKETVNYMIKYWFWLVFVRTIFFFEK